MITRRWLTGLAATVFAAVPRSDAQQAIKHARMSYVHPVLPAAGLTAATSVTYRAVLEELQRLGYVEGQNLIVDRWSAEGRTERHAELAREVVASRPDVILVTSAPLTRAMRAATATIPIVASTADPVAMGFAASLSRPGGNITGISIDPGLDIVGKRVELMRELFPGASRMAYLGRRLSWDEPDGRFVRQICARVGITPVHAPLDDPIREPAYRHAFAVMARERVDSILVAAHAENGTYAELIAGLAVEARLPSIHELRSYVEVGGLIAYGTDFTDMYRRLGGTVAQVLRGTPPGDIPFQQPARFELVINLKTAKALGLTIPPAILARADEVIE
jgi:putative ABC transport system substrate-binding protein